jgi:hypothetical protein
MTTEWQAERRVQTSDDLFTAMLDAKGRMREREGHDDRFTVDCGRIDADHAQTHLVPLALRFAGADYGLASASFNGRVTLTFKRLKQ